MTLVTPIALNSNEDELKNLMAENVAEVEFIGKPQYSILDLDNNGDWDIIQFNQTVNITKPGSGPLIMNSAVYLTAGNTTTSLTIVEGDTLEGGIINSSKVGLQIIMKWVLRPYEKMFKGFTTYNVSWIPTLQPADSEMKLSSIKYTGTEVKITFDNTQNYNPPSISFENISDVTGDISPAYANIITNKTLHRTIGTQYTWNTTIIGNSTDNINSKLSIGVKKGTNSTIRLTITNMTTELVVKPTINKTKELNETLAGYPYSYAFIPVNVSTDKLLEGLRQNYAQLKLLALANNGSMFEFSLNESNGFFGYSVLLNFTQKSSPTEQTQYIIINMLIYHVTTGVLYSGVYSTSQTRIQGDTKTRSHSTYIEELENFALTPKLLDWKIINIVPALTLPSATKTITTTPTNTSTTTSQNPTETITSTKYMSLTTDPEQTTMKVTTAHTEYILGLTGLVVITLRKKRK